MMRSRLSLIMYTLVFTLVAVPAVYAQSEADAIRTLLEQRDTEIKQLLGASDDAVDEASRERLRVVINDFIDFNAMGQEALGTHWDTLSEAQRAEFVNVFSDIVRRQSLADLAPYRATVEYGDITVEGTSANVVTRTVVDDVPMTVAYRLVQSGSGWRAKDIVLDEVSTAEGYARSFQTMIRKRGFDVLMDRLRKRQESLAQTG